MTSHYNARIIPSADRATLEAELTRVAADPAQPAGAGAELRVVRLDNLAPATADGLRQEVRAAGGDALLGAPEHEGSAGALVFATRGQYAELLVRLQRRPELHQLAAELGATLDAFDTSERGELALRGRRWRWGERTLVMGILNVTPDSFSGDGLARDDDLVRRALEQARGFAAAGVDILDVGGESTRPGAELVDEARERERVVPVIRALRGELDLPISIDTYKAGVAEAALDAGADMLNDVWGLRTAQGGWNTAMARLAAERAAPIVIMHNRRATAASGSAGGHYRAVSYDDLLGDILRELRESVDVALANGVQREQIVLDPGIGFGKTPAQNVVVLRRLAEFRSLGFPLLLGTSRKSFIGIALGGVPPEERMEGTAATVALGINAGVDIVRVHDVAAMVKVARMTDAIVRS